MIALLGWLGVVVSFLWCMMILEKLVKRGGGRVSVGDAWYCGSALRICNAVYRSGS